jgi:signal transduction histidine kinase
MVACARRVWSAPFFSSFARVRIRAVEVVAGRRAARAGAGSLAGFSRLVLAAARVFVPFNARVMNGGEISLYVLFAAACVAFAGVGFLLASRVPRNAIGWLLSLIGLCVAVSLFLEQYGLHGLATAPGSLPAVRTITAFSGSAGLLAPIPLIIVVLLFPTGRLPSRRWRPVLWAAAGAVVISGTGPVLERGKLVSGSLTSILQQAHVAYPNPLGVFPSHGWYGDLLRVAGVVAWLTAFLAVLSVLARRRGAAAELRQQLAWLGYVGVMFVVFAIPGIAYAGATHGGGNSPVGTVLFALFGGTALLGIPVACAVAVLKYRLYDLDVVVRKTVVAGLLAGAFTVIYALVVLGVGAVVGRPGSSVLTFAAAAIAAVLLQPARGRARLIADRLVYGRRATPYEVLSEFSAGMAGTYPTEEVLPRMARMLAEATGADRAEVWMQTDGTSHREAAWPVPTGPVPAVAAMADGADSGRDDDMVRAGAVPDDGAAPAEDARTREFAVEHRGERMGSLRVTSSLREPLTPAGERLVRDVAGQAGLVLRNVALIEDLRASRQRIVAAADQARRGLERDLHDGAQQQLVALRIKLGLARQVMQSSPGQADELMAETELAAAGALEELRDLARGIYPTVLADLGLRAALQAQARKAALPVTIEADGIGRYPQHVEAAVYFSVLEALQNTAKYAQASSALVSLGHDDRCLTFTVQDDGKGFDPAAVLAGTGMHGMADRCAALGGDLQIDSAPGLGTRITGRIPAPAT